MPTAVSRRLHGCNSCPAGCDQLALSKATRLKRGKDKGERGKEKGERGKGKGTSNL